MKGKRSPDSGDRPFAQRVDDQGPRAYRRLWTPYARNLTGDCSGDVKAALVLLAQGGKMRSSLRNKGYDSDQLLRSRYEIGAAPLLLDRLNRKRFIR